MGQAVDIHRLHFAFTITFHYIFPQLTMGLALLLVYLKTKALRTAMNITTVRHDSGRGSSGLILRWALSPHPDGISVRHELGCVFENRGRRHWPNTGDGRGFSFFLESSFLDCFCSVRKT